MRFSPAKIWVFALGCLSPRSVTVQGGAPVTIGPDEACVDFAADQPPGSTWTLADCTYVWTQFTSTVPSGLRGRFHYTDDFKETATELRRAGTPCLANAFGGGDGVGSTTLRILSSWILADEMGCDWVTPSWGRRHVGGGNGTAVLYCHRTLDREKLGLANRPLSTLMELSHCSVVDWLAYFQFDVNSVDLPEGAKIKTIQVGVGSLKAIERAASALKDGSVTNEGCTRLMFKYDLSFASRHLLAIGNWDEDRRQRVRTIIGQARQNFHLHPRPWYEETPECAYDPIRLNFAIHIRMGDRRVMLGESPEYFHLLELFVDTVSKEVVRRGLEPPLFHVFSETLIPCPPEDTGTFDEFPSWPVHQDPGCLTAEVPDDCPEKRAGYACSPIRPGTFDVVGKPIVLHVGSDAHNALQCMIQADGLLMGCSTFGQIAGIFSQGISFFSMKCGGFRTPTQYKIIPPIAVAERGHLWVPVEGSWHDPVLNSTEVLNGALNTHLSNKRRV